MIYLINLASAVLVGMFDTIAAAKTHLASIGVTSYENYVFTGKVTDMSYLSRICFVDDECIYNNKTFWSENAQAIYDNYSNHVVTDCFGQTVYSDQFKKELEENGTRIGMVLTSADEVAYNIKIGKEFISLFREQCITSDIGSQSGLSIASALSNVIPLVQTGSFKEAAVVLSTVTRNDFLTDELLNKYMYMLLAADIITYLK